MRTPTASATPRTPLDLFRPTTPDARMLRGPSSLSAETGGKSADFAQTLRDRKAQAKQDDASEAKKASGEDEDAASAEEPTEGERTDQAVDADASASVDEQPADGAEPVAVQQSALSEQIVERRPAPDGAAQLDAKSDAAATSAPTDMTAIARQLAKSSTIDQAKTGPLTAQLLTELSLQGRNVGKFALVEGGRPAAVKTNAKASAGDPREAFAAGTAVGSSSGGVDRGSSVNTTSSIAPLREQDTAPARRTETTSVRMPEAPAGAAKPTDERSVREHGAPAERAASGSTGAQRAPAVDQAGTGQQRGSGGQERRESGKQGEAAVRGLDALMSREARGSQAIASSFKANAAGKGSSSGAEQQALAGQIDRGLAAALNTKNGVVTIRLSPEQLGPLKINVRVENGSVSAKFEAASAKAQSALKESLTALKDGLEAKGLTVERMDVLVAPALPQRELGLGGVFEQASASAMTTGADAQASTSFGQMSGDAHTQSEGQGGRDGGGTPFERGSDAEELVELDAGSVERPGLRYVTTPDGRLGVVALA